jgi:SAM-dependent methyltransferase
MKPASSKRELNPVRLRQALLGKLQGRIAAKGEFTFAAVPALVDHIHSTLITLFGALARPPAPEQSAALRQHLEHWAHSGWESSPFSRLVIQWATNPQGGVDYQVSAHVVSMSEEYAQWRNNLGSDLFGERPDSKVLAVAASLGEPKSCRILDVGAGEGRNTLPLLRAGYPVDAVEPAPKLAERLRERADAEGFSPVLFLGLLEQQDLGIPKGHYDLLVLSEVVSTHLRSVPQLKALLHAAHGALKPGGRLLLDAFLPLDGYKPDNLVRETAQCQWCTLFTRGEFETCLREAGFDRIEEVSALDWERTHLPPEQWPPTPWFATWAGGGNVFALPEGKSPLELRWVVARATAQ